MKLRRLALVYFVLTGIGANVLAAVVLIYAGQQALALGLPLPVLMDKVLLKVEEKFPEYSWVLSNKLGIKRQPYQNTLRALPDLAPERFAHADLARQIITYDESGKPQSLAAGSPPASGAARRIVAISTSTQLLAAIKTAQPGDVISLAPGDYAIAQRSIPVSAAGRPDAPIVVRAQDRHTVRIKLDSLEGFHVRAPFWRFENLSIAGVCADHNNCEHAFHVVGGGRSVVIRDNVIKNFNAAIKVNASDVEGRRQFPDAGLIQNNAIFNTAVRQTGNPVTPVDIVTASDWVVRGNLIADFAKGHGNKVSYAAFMKGNSAQGLFERNLVICEMKVIGSGIRLGLSFGGGGTGAGLCRDGSCATEHSRGTIRNNIIMRCPRDVGIYLNRAAATEIYNNTLHQTLGIDVRFAQSTATVANNIISGRILDRDGAYSEQMRNLTSAMSPWFWESGPQDWFANPDGGDFTLRSPQELLGRGIGVVDGVTDFCGQKRSQSGTDLGAIEYSGNDSCEPLKLFVH